MQIVKDGTCNCDDSNRPYIRILHSDILRNTRPSIYPQLSTETTYKSVLISSNFEKINVSTGGLYLLNPSNTETRQGTSLNSSNHYQNLLRKVRFNNETMYFGT